VYSSGIITEGQMAKKENIKVINKGGPAGGAFFITYIGAAIYFVDKADGFGEVVVALLQALVWPAYLVNKIFTILQIS
jgi:hypothetical protein